MGSIEPTEITFDFLSDRLWLIDVADDDMLNTKLWLHLSTFESHVYGVLLQYNRIKTDLAFFSAPKMARVPGPQARLDIYYYILTWDKLEKINEKIKAIVNDIQRGTPSPPKGFVTDFKAWKNRANHLFAEFGTEVRNEYEHPSLEPHLAGNLIMWGNIIIDKAGNIKAHAGNDRFAIIKEEHCKRMQNLRIDLFDLFIKHFSQKPSTKELMETRNHIEENIDYMVKELQRFKADNDWTGFNELLCSLIMKDSYLMRESIPLSKEAKEKLYSVIW